MPRLRWTRRVGDRIIARACAWLLSLLGSSSSVSSPLPWGGLARGKLDSCRRLLQVMLVLELRKWCQPNRVRGSGRKQLEVEHNRLLQLRARGHDGNTTGVPANAEMGRDGLQLGAALSVAAGGVR